MFDGYTVKRGDSPKSILAELGQDWNEEKWRELMHFNRVQSFVLALFGVPHPGTVLRRPPEW